MSTQDETTPEKPATADTQPDESARPAASTGEEPAAARATPGEAVGASVPAGLISPANIKAADEATIAEAAALLAAGEVVAFPTETVYGLGADATNAAAIAKVFALKGRPPDHPLIVHVREASEIERWGRDISSSARTLARAFWPGPLTIVLRRAESVLDAITGGQDTVAIRVPSHPAARALLEAFGGAIVAPSANKFGRVSPTTARHVFADFQLAVPIILDGGPAQVGIESTIVDCTCEPPRILRPGGITSLAIEAALDATLAGDASEAPRVPGSLEAHYAPRARLSFARRLEILEMLGHHKGRRVGVIGLEVSVPRLAQSLQRVFPVVAAEYQRGLYAALRELDAAGADMIIVESPPRTPAWSAVWDRLERAAAAHAKSGKTEKRARAAQS